VLQARLGRSVRQDPLEQRVPQVRTAQTVQRVLTVRREQRVPQVRTVRTVLLARMALTVRREQPVPLVRLGLQEQRVQPAPLEQRARLAPPGRPASLGLSVP